MTAPADNTPASIIADSMFEAGFLQEGQSPNGEQLTRNSRRLRDLIGYYMTRGIKLWLQLDQSVTLLQGQAKYTFKPSGDVSMVRPLRVIQGYYRDISGGATNPVDSPIFPMSWQEYLNLSNKGTGTGSQGRVSQFFVDKQATELDVTFWMTPDSSTAANGTAHLLLQQQVTYFTGLTDTMNFPIEWRMALVWGLADQLATGQPMATIHRCESNAEKYRMALEDWDVEDAPTSFAPDSRTGYGGGRSFI